MTIIVTDVAVNLQAFGLLTVSHCCHHLCLVRTVLSQPPDSEQHAYLSGTPCRRWLCIAGVDAANNDNVDVGGNQAALDFGNNANQINAAG